MKKIVYDQPLCSLCYIFFITEDKTKMWGQNALQGVILSLGELYFLKMLEMKKHKNISTLLIFNIKLLNTMHYFRMQTMIKMAWICLQSLELNLSNSATQVQYAKNDTDSSSTLLWIVVSHLESFIVDWNCNYLKIK